MTSLLLIWVLLLLLLHLYYKYHLYLYIHSIFTITITIANLQSTLYFNLLHSFLNLPSSFSPQYWSVSSRSGLQKPSAKQIKRVLLLFPIDSVFIQKSGLRKRELVRSAKRLHQSAGFLETTEVPPVTRNGNLSPPIRNALNTR
jgi:hypothetical protein